MADESSASHDPHIEKALKVAFESSADGGPNPGKPGPSVLDEIARRAGGAPRLCLRDDPSDHAETPVIDAHTSEHQSTPSGRHGYQILGEIARGGMGVILKGHDRDLGRDVALKVLRKDRADSPALLQRFVEEAQIGGQLQHPGIVPVHELGLMEDQRPYFTMKLVKGHTLSEILAGRKGTSDERRRLLAIFEAICQTVGYAHSRGVIHRDLKPSNIMVGNFGEVHVMDWGLAKVLRRGGTADEKRAKVPNISIIETVRSAPGSSGSDSLVGSVMGTPAYMSPEQARGEVERIDERSDVFALGAILCEILTGRPPYPGEGDETFVEAAQARLEPAYVRLDGCDADPGLVAIAKKCLIAAPAARSRNAAAIAKEIATYLSETEERARRAQIDAAETRVKVAEERKRRKLSVTLLGSVIVTLLVGGGAWIRSVNARNERIGRADAEVGKVIQEMYTLREQRRWNEALEAGSRAESMLASSEASRSVRERVTALVQEVSVLADAARAEQERAERNRRLLERLQATYSKSQLGYPNAIDAEYAAAFREYGAEPDSVGLDGAIEVLKRGEFAQEIAPYLDLWAEVKKNVEGGTSRFDVISMARAIDSDPFRTRIRSAWLDGDAGALRALARSSEVEALPSSSIDLLASNLLSSGFTEDANSLLTHALRTHPEDFLSNLRLGTLILDEPSKANEAMRWFSAAHALQPESPDAVIGLERAMEASGRRDEALRLCRDAVARQPESTEMRWVLAQHFRRHGDTAAASVEMREALSLEPGNEELWANLAEIQYEGGDVVGAIATCREGLSLAPNARQSELQLLLGRAHLKLGQLEDAARDFGIFLESPGEPWRRYRVAVAYRELGHRELAIENLRSQVRAYPDYTDARILLAAILDPPERLVQMRANFLQWPDNPAVVNVLAGELATTADERYRDPPQAVALARRALELDPRASFLNTLGIALYRNGDLDGAVEALRASIERCAEGDDPSSNWLFLAMALEKKGEHAEARTWFDKAVERMPTQKNPDPDLPRYRAEAAAILGTQDK